MAMKLRPLAKNMTVLEKGDTSVLFSYSTPVAACINGKYYRTDSKWSATTSRHIDQWLSGTTAELKPQWFFNEIGGN